MQRGDPGPVALSWRRRSRRGGSRRPSVTTTQSTVPRAVESASIIDIQGWVPPKATTCPTVAPFSTRSAEIIASAVVRPCAVAVGAGDDVRAQARGRGPAPPRPPPPRPAPSGDGRIRRRAARVRHAHPLEEPHLEPHRRLHLGRHLHHRVGHAGQLLELLGAARAGLHVGQGLRPVAPGQHAERELGQVVRVLRHIPALSAHRSSLTPSDGSTAARRRMRAVLMRVFAVPRGMPSASLISSAVRP